MKCQYCDGEMKAKPPFSRIEARGGAIEFGAQEIMLYIRQPKRIPVSLTIPYEEIYDVSYVPAQGWFSGFLCIREKKNRHIPLPRKVGQQRLGDTFIYFDKWDNDGFLQAYRCLASLKNSSCPGCSAPVPPFSQIKAQGGFIQLDSRSIRLCVKHPRVPRIDVTIPYEQISDVSYVPGNWWHNGFIGVREKKNCHIPLPRKFGQQRLRDTLALFDEKKNDVFYRVYVFLKANIRDDRT